MEEGEYTTTPGPEGESWASHVVARGDIWQSGRDTGIWHWRFRGMDDHGVPRYNPQPVHSPMPDPFSDLLRTDYQPETDTMCLSGQTRDRPITNGAWGTAGTLVARFDHWSDSPQLRYRTDLPYTPEKCLPESLRVAGDLFFVVECKTAEVWVYGHRKGKTLGTLRPGPEVNGESG
jgi:hypothetical protein